MAEDEFPEGRKNKSSEILMQNIEQLKKWIDEKYMIFRWSDVFHIAQKKSTCKDQFLSDLPEIDYYIQCSSIKVHICAITREIE